MKRFIVISFLLGGIFLVSGCGERSCESGAKVGAPWDQLQLPIVAGGEVCFSYDNMLGIVHYGAAPFELIHKYQEALQSSGWQVDSEPAPSGSDMRFLRAVKGEKKLSVSSAACTRNPLAQLFSKCGLVQFSPSTAP